MIPLIIIPSSFYEILLLCKIEIFYLYLPELLLLLKLLFDFIFFNFNY